MIFCRSTAVTGCVRGAFFFESWIYTVSPGIMVSEWRPAFVVTDLILDAGLTRSAASGAGSRALGPGQAASEEGILQVTPSSGAVFLFEDGSAVRIPAAGPIGSFGCSGRG